MIRFCYPFFFFFFTSSLFSQPYSEPMDEMKQPHDSVVFMGNSIIQGWRQVDPDLFTKTKFINRGIGGQTTSQMLARFERDVIEIRPQAVLILAGTNDIAGNTGEISLEEIRDNIGQMVSMAMKNEIEVILCSVLPAFDYPWRPGRNPDSKIPKLNAMLKELSEKHDLYYLDYFSRMKDERNGLPKEFAEDGVHPTKAGYEVMKKMTLEAFKKMGLTN
jgi:lysophospholipase L1-like esterase